MSELEELRARIEALEAGKILGTPENWESGRLGCDERYARQACLWDLFRDDVTIGFLSCPCAKCTVRFS